MTPPNARKKPIDDCIRDSLEAYFRDLRGTEPQCSFQS